VASICRDHHAVRARQLAVDDDELLRAFSRAIPSSSVESPVTGSQSNAKPTGDWAALLLRPDRPIGASAGVKTNTHRDDFFRSGRQRQKYSFATS